MILNQSSQWTTVRGHQVLLGGAGNGVCFSSCLLVLVKVQVHFVTVKVSVVGVAIGVVHAEGLFVGEHAHPMGHHGWLVEGWLAVHEDNITVHDVTMNFGDGSARGGSLGEEAGGDGRPGSPAHVLQAVERAIPKLDVCCTGVLPWSPNHCLLQAVLVEGSDGLGVGELAGKDKGDTDLPGANVGVGGDDGAGSKVDTLAHHVLPK